jgi:hypothetical protein
MRTTFIGLLVLSSLLSIAITGNSFNNCLLNGDFTQPQGDWIHKQFSDGVTGWKGKIDIGQGKHFNSRWNKQIKVAHLDPGINANITQTVDLPKGNYTLMFDYSAYQGAVNSSQGEIYWNGKKVLDLKPKD